MVQIAEQVTAPKTLEATLSYSLDTETMPVTLVGAPGRSDRRVGGGTSEPRRVVIRNGRLSTDDFVLERNGFRFVRHDTRVVDFFDEDEVRCVYYPEMQALVKAETGAARVEVFDHTLRTADDELRETRKIREVVRRVHNDYTEWSGPQRVRTFLPNEADELLRRRFAVIRRVHSGCAPFYRTRPTSCSGAALPSSRCGARSVIRSRAGRWRSPTRRASRPKIWW